MSAATSAFAGKAENICSLKALSDLTHSGRPVAKNRLSSTSAEAEVVEALF
jgi:hypothetical protein